MKDETIEADTSAKGETRLRYRLIYDWLKSAIAGSRLRDLGLVERSAYSHWICDPLTARAVRNDSELRSLLEPAALAARTPRLSREMLETISHVHMPLMVGHAFFNAFDLPPEVVALVEHRGRGRHVHCNDSTLSLCYRNPNSLDSCTGLHGANSIRHPYK